MYRTFYRETNAWAEKRDGVETGVGNLSGMANDCGISSSSPGCVDFCCECEVHLTIPAASTVPKQASYLGG